MERVTGGWETLCAGVLPAASRCAAVSSPVHHGKKVSNLYDSQKRIRAHLHIRTNSHISMKSDFSLFIMHAKFTPHSFSCKGYSQT